MTTAPRTPRNARRALTTLALLAALAAAVPALAGDAEGTGYRRDREGWLVGLNVGFGGASYGADEGRRSYTDDPFTGAFGAVRVGYAFSNAFALTLEGMGFGTSEGGRDDEGWGLGAGLVTATWYPGGGGFFVRGGLGAGGGEIRTREPDRIVEFESEFAGLFGIGYEWQVSRDLGLAVAADGLGFDLDGASGAEEDFVGVGTFSIQGNWYF